MLLLGGLSEKEQLSVNISIGLSLFTYVYTIQNFAQSTAFTPAAPLLIIASLQSACCAGAPQYSVHETDFSVLTQHTQHRQTCYSVHYLLCLPPADAVHHWCFTCKIKLVSSSSSLSGCHRNLQ